MRRGVAVTVALIAIIAPVDLAAEEVKIATLVPRGTAWAKALERGAREIERRTEGRVQTKYYFGGVQGDERDTVRKMRIGQIDGAVLSSLGLSLIDDDIQVLQLPLLFASEAEVDHVRARVAPDLERSFAKAGYVILSWGDLGWVYLFTTREASTAGAMRGLKFWFWTDSPIMRALLENLKLSGVPLGVHEVMTGLQTGLVEACYNSPLGAVALQWYTHVHYAYTPPLTYGIGAMVVRKDRFERLSAADQAVVREVSTTLSAELIRIVRRDNARARKTLEKAGIRFVPVAGPWAAEAARAAFAVWGQLSGSVYPPELLAKVKAALAEVRAKGH